MDEGEMLLFDSFLCFDWKVFGFHKQQTIPFGEVLALLRSAMNTSFTMNY